MDSLLEPEQSLSQHQVLDAPWGEIGRSVTLGLVAGISKLVLGVLNRVEVDGADTFLQHVLEREPGRGLITVSNHTRCVVGVPGDARPTAPAAQPAMQESAFERGGEGEGVAISTEGKPAPAGPLPPRSLLPQHGGRPGGPVGADTTAILLHRVPTPRRAVEPVRRGAVLPQRHARVRWPFWWGKGMGRTPSAGPPNERCCAGHAMHRDG